MGGNRSGTTPTWTSDGRRAAIQGAQATVAARARQLLEKAAASRVNGGTSDTTPLPATGVSKPLPDGLRYRRTLTPEARLLVGDGAPLLDMMRRTAHDRRDRVVMAWPCRPDNGFVTGGSAPA